MPIGSPKPNTIAKEKYQKKIGMISKSYKLDKKLVEEFKEACDKNGTSQAAELSRFMRRYIRETNEALNDIQSL